MLRKVAAVIMMLAICFSGAACAQKNGCKTSGKPYINRNEQLVVTDGFKYWTEENQTDNFIAYKNSKGETVLYVMREGKSSPYSTDGLCDVTPGKAYTITYDSQHVTGGVAGVHEYYFLTVYSCEECSYDRLFENGISWNSDWVEDYPIIGGRDGSRFVALKGAFGGYDVFTEMSGKLHFNQIREVMVPLTVNGRAEELQINVFCNWVLSNDYIINKMVTRKYENEKKFVFMDCYHTDIYDKTSDYNCDTFEKLATGSKYYRNDFKFYIDEGEKPAEGRRLITYEEMASMTAEELGLEDWLYNNIYYGWKDREKGRESVCNEEGGPPRKCDVLIFTGNFERDTFINYDKNLRLEVIGSVPLDEDAGEGAFQYYILFLNSDFNDFLPQE